MIGNRSVCKTLAKWYENSCFRFLGIMTNTNMMLIKVRFVLTAWQTQVSISARGLEYILNRYSYIIYAIHDLPKDQWSCLIQIYRFQTPVANSSSLFLKCIYQISNATHPQDIYLYGHNIFVWQKIPKKLQFLSLDCFLWIKKIHLSSFLVCYLVKRIFFTLGKYTSCTD